LLGTGRFVALEGIPIGLAHFEEVGDSEVVAVAACEGEALGAEKKFMVRVVVAEAADAQAREDASGRAAHRDTSCAPGGRLIQS